MLSVYGVIAALLIGAEPSGAHAATITNSLGIELKLIPAGEFQMGSPKGEPGRAELFGDHTEFQHRVRITNPFYIGIYHVTQGEYERLVGINPSRYSSTGEYSSSVQGLNTERFPVENVTWYEAEEFCRKLSAKEGRIYRLPTEAEWEYACRAGTTTPFYFGSTCNGTEANCDGTQPYGTAKHGPDLGRPTLVGSYQPNAFGLYDMHGNVYQWCSDWFASGYYERSPLNNPRGVQPSDLNPNAEQVRAGTFPRAARGGGHHVEAARLRSASRTSFEPYKRAAGFRVVCETPLPEVEPSASAITDESSTPTNPQWIEINDLSAAEQGRVAAIRKLRGDVKVAIGREDSPIIHVAFRHTPTTDADLAAVEALPNLRHLMLWHTHITNSALRRLQALRELRTLLIASSRIDDDGVAELTRLSNLHGLSLCGRKITDASLKHVEHWKQLRLLDLRQSTITDQGLERLAALSELQELCLSGTRIKGSGLAAVATLKSLESLWLDETDITDAALNELRSMAALKSLRLSSTEISDEGLKHLHGLVSLRTLSLDGTRSTSAGVRELQQALPKLKITQ